MLRFKIRLVSLMSVVLFALVADNVDAQEAANPGGHDAKVKELQKERIETARELVKQQMARLNAGRADVQEIIEANRVLLEAELDACASDQERSAALERLLVAANENERIAANFSKTGQGRQSTALSAKAERLRIEIALERAKAKKDVPQKGAANSEPDAKIKKENQPKTTTQIATIQAYESVDLSARASGFLKKQTVDIGDRVKRDQVLAVLDVPDLEAQVRHDTAAVDRERSRVSQAKGRIHAAAADLEIANLAVKQAEANVKSAIAWTQHRKKQWTRMKDLAKSVDERLVDECKDRYEAALEAERSAKVAVSTAKAHLAAAETKIEQAKSEVAVAEADVKVAQTKLEKSQVHLSFATIAAPFDGIVAQRGYVPGDFIRSAENGKRTEPLLTIQRTDLMRVIVNIPEREVRFVDVGDAAELEVDALPGKKWSAKISRMGGTLDPETRSMAVEMDLPNPTGHLLPGMYGRVTIVLNGKKE